MCLGVGYGGLDTVFETAEAHVEYQWRTQAFVHKRTHQIEPRRSADKTEQRAARFTLESISVDYVPRYCSASRRVHEGTIASSVWYRATSVHRFARSYCHTAQSASLKPSRVPSHSQGLQLTSMSTAPGRPRPRGQSEDSRALTSGPRCPHLVSISCLRVHRDIRTTFLSLLSSS